jgi:hypothetical protein
METHSANISAGTNTNVAEVKMPTTGRIVHFFTTDKLIKTPDGAAVQAVNDIPYPAMVMCDDEYPTLSVFTGNQNQPILIVSTVMHKSKLGQHDDKQYWDWPVIK